MILAGKRFGYLFVCLLCLAACSRDRAKPERERKSADRDFRTVVYTDEFRRRFSLEEAGNAPLAPGLQAIAIRLQHSPYHGPECFIDLYLDDSIDFDYPEGSSGSFEDTSAYGAMFFANGLSSADSKAIHARWTKPRWKYRSLSYGKEPKRGVMESGPIDAYVRNLLPDLNLVTMRVVPWLFKPDQGPAELLLLRKDSPPSALDAAPPNPDQIITLPVPDAIVRHAAPAMQIAGRNPALPGPSGEFPKATFSLPPRSSPP